MVSIFSPTHNPKYLKEVYKTLQEQTLKDWEWIIVSNRGAKVPKFKDKRVRVFEFPIKEDWKMGALKNFACSKCKGEILVELDHDDFLTPNCLEEIKKAFDSDPKITMVYSNVARVDMNWQSLLWSSDWGWRYRDFEYKGHNIKEVISPEPYVANLSRIWYAPDHVRAWRASHYIEMGGHDKSLKIADDHNLVVRSYLHGKIHHIDKCLYIYRVHEDNTWLPIIPEITKTQWQNYERFILPMIEKWCDENQLLKIDLCGGINKRQGYKSIDLQNADIIADLDNDFPLKDNSVGVIYANDAIEHLKDPIHTMNECYRVLTHGGFLMINVPSTIGVGAFCDPTHKSFWNIRSFRYYTEAFMRRFIEPSCKCRFQIMRLDEGTLYEGIPYVFANLIAIKKDQPRFHGLLKI